MKRLMLPVALFLAVLIGIFTFGIQSTPPGPPHTPTPQEPAPAPTSLRPTKLIIANLPTQNALSWDDVIGASQYEVQMQERVTHHPRDIWTDWKTIGTPTRPNFIHNIDTPDYPITPGTLYQYRVRALDHRNRNPIEEWSNIRQRTVPVPPTPSP